MFSGELADHKLTLIKQRLQLGRRAQLRPIITNVVLVKVLVKAPRPVAETDKVTLVVSLFKTDNFLTSFGDR